MDGQIENAVQIAWNPAADPNLKTQAINFLNQIRSDPSAGQYCLTLFVRSPKAEEIVRHFCLEVINNAIQSPQVDKQTLEYIRSELMQYTKRTYGGPPTADKVETPHIQNKLTQALTALFASLYPTSWTSCLADFRSLAEGEPPNIAESNPIGTIMYLRLLGSIHDEIADVLAPRSGEEQRRNNDLKDLIRERDAQAIATSWQDILSKWSRIDQTIVEMCIRTISRWVSWMDISLIVNQTLISALFDIAGQQVISRESDEGRAKLRDVAIEAFSETVAKKMKPAEKIQLMVYLNLSNVVDQLIASQPLSQLRFTSQYDTDLAEMVARLVNNVVFDIVKVLDTQCPPEVHQQADLLLSTFVPFLLRFFSDEFDEVCSTVIPSLTDLLTFFRKRKDTLPDQYQRMLPSILDAIIAKMKYDETASWGEEGEETDEAEFQDLRRRLFVLQQTVAAINEPLVMETIARIVTESFQKFQVHQSGIDWRELDLALQELFLVLEVVPSKGSGMFSKHKPGGAPTQSETQAIGLLSKMIELGIGTHGHPAVQLQYMEICNRYSQALEINPGLIPPILENFIRFLHSSHLKVRTRSWYLFLKLVKPLKTHIGSIVSNVIEAIADLLVIKAELPEASADEEMSSSEEDQSSDAKFEAQLNLFEAVGCMLSATTVEVDKKILYAQSVMNPIFGDMEKNLPAAKGGDETAVLQLHHDIMALGTLARGFSDWQPGSSVGNAPPSIISEAFVPAAEVTLVALEALAPKMAIRTAGRFTFSRLIGVLGSNILQQLPRWIQGLLSQSSTNDEMTPILRSLKQIVFAFKTEIYGILDTIVTPLLQRIFSGLGEPATGTDEEIQLAELRREFLDFISCILNNDLASVFVSQTNQPIFDTLITAICTYAGDASDMQSARMSLGVLSRFISVWGGPDVALPESFLQNLGLHKPNQPQINGQTSEPSPIFPGFDTFALQRFAPLAWAVPTSNGFTIKYPLGRGMAIEISKMQIKLLRKTGLLYVRQLEGELTAMQVSEATVTELIKELCRGMLEQTHADGKGPTTDRTSYETYFLRFMSGMGNA
ncbi:karyopherin-beta [Eremomyces bilateralis CBS 781.70]|uniref:Exportin-T n=1 Tax=Eremomyces bilateralis CBS 781.70 TaxID=1392243 RepID=A0A6G1GCI8_9PEZI|nr:karyopherin-beta [Eremomyces bilateralis CBS 781.70]KAF1815712.1 karyopherin-beta [Eremomyces bilateralis CBS 781.70]